MRLSYEVVEQLSALPEEAVQWLYQKVLAWVHGHVWRLALPATVQRPALVAGWQAPMDAGDLVRFERWMRRGKRQWVFAS